MTTTTMIYDVKKFGHFLVAYRFSFNVDHRAMLYLVKKTYSIGRMSWWIMNLLEFDFKAIVKKGNDPILLCPTHDCVMFANVLFGF